jgi:hypothetical protein
MEMPKEYKAFVADAVRKNPVIKKMMTEYIKGERTMEGCTFHHIIIFLEQGIDTGRLSVALDDFGLSRDDIEGKKPIDVAKEWLGE